MFSCRCYFCFVVVTRVIFVVVAIIALMVVSIFSCLFLVFVVVLSCCYGVVLLSKQERGNKSINKKGAKKGNDVRSKSKGAVVFPNVKIMVFLFFCLYVCFFKNTTKRGFSQFWALFFVDFVVPKVVSISGPQLGQ